MEPPSLPPPPPGQPPPLDPAAPSPDTSSLAAGVILGLLGVPLLVGAFWSVFGGMLSALPSPVAAQLGPTIAVLLGLGALAIVVGVPVGVYRKGWRRMGQGVLIGYGILAVVVGGCFVLVIVSLSNASFQ